jgi:glucosyl-dolichyl phosphate glucuronosyltransferase
VSTLGVVAGGETGKTMKITVILCTYNRCQSLAKALESVAASTLPQSVEWEVLVVDNNSRDRTREVVEDFCRRYPGRFRYLFEPQPGKSHALNYGIREARGDVLAFMDDDVTAEPKWLQNLTAALHNGEWAGAGGRVLRIWTCSPPHWLSVESPYEKMGWPLVIFDLGQEAGELPYTPCGTNMAFRKEVFIKYGGFRTDLGPQPDGFRTDLGPQPGNEIQCCEDSEFGQRLVAAGERLRYEPSAVIYHPVPENRLKKDYFLAWWFDYGRGSVRLYRDGPAIWGIPRNYLRLLRMTTQLLGRTLGWIVALKPYRRFYYKVQVLETAGAITEGYQRWFGARTNATPKSNASRCGVLNPKSGE